MLAPDNLILPEIDGERLRRCPSNVQNVGMTLGPVLSTRSYSSRAGPSIARAGTPLMPQEQQVREQLAGRVALRVSRPAEAIARMILEDARLGEIWQDYMLCQETIERFRMKRDAGDARVAEYELLAGSLEDEIALRVEDLQS